LPANPVPSPRETPAAHSAGGAAGAPPARGGLSLGQGPKGPRVFHPLPVRQGRSLPPRRPPGRLDAEARARGFALLQTAEGRFQWGDLEGAERFTREALEALPKEPRAHYFLGLLLMARGQPEAAATAFEKTLALDKDHTDARSKLRMAKEHASFRKKVDYDTVAP